MKKICNEIYELSAAGVDRASERFGQILEDVTDLDRKGILRLRLSLEEIMLDWMEKTDDENVVLKIQKRGKKILVQADLRTKYLEEINPLEENEAFGDNGFARGILANQGADWLYRMNNGTNSVIITVSAKKSNPMLYMLLAVVGGVLLGAGMGYMPEGFVKVCSDCFIEPLFETYMGFLSAVVSPMMFFSVAWGVFSIGNPQQLGTMGKGVCLRFLSYSVVATLLGLIALALFYPIELSYVDGGSSQIKELLDMIYDIVPSNFVEPFITGNTMQIIFLAVVVGVVMILIQNQIPTVAAFGEQCNILIQKLLSIVSGMISAFIFLSILRLMLSGQLGEMAGFLKMIVLYLIAVVVMILLNLVVAARVCGISMVKYWKNLLPSFIVALTTASSAAAFVSMKENCNQKMGVQKQLVDFGLPLGTVLVKPAFATWLVLLGGACAEVCGVSMTLSSVLMTGILAFLLSVAAPPVPGGALACYSILLMQLGLPLELLAVASAINAVVDFTGTANHVFAIQTQILVAGKKLNMVDETELYKNFK